MGPRHSLVGLTKNAVKTTNKVTIISYVAEKDEINDVVTLHNNAVME